MVNLKNGFTLIELVVTLAVLAIAVGLAAPSFTQQIRNNSSVSLASEFQTALGFARSEAVKRASRISLCPSSDGASCLTAEDWTKGWMVFVDGAPADSTAEVTVGEPLKFWGGLNKNVKITAKKGNTALSYIRFTGAGILARSSAADKDERSFEISAPHCTGDSARKIVVGFSGMQTTTKVVCN